MLAYILCSYTFFCAVLIVVYAIGGNNLQLIRVCVVFVLTFGLFGIAYFTGAWKMVSHLVLWICTIVVWSNLSIYVHSINIATLQFIWLGCAMGFYMHGLKWGWFYAAINILPVLLFTALDSKNFFQLGNGPQIVGQMTYLFVISYNFFLIKFLQYHFFKALIKNFLNLTRTKNELRELNNKLQDSLLAVEKLSTARMDFLSAMSHELRTPLNGVIGMSNALSLQDPRPDQKEHLDVLQFSAEHLLSLINDVLDFNKFDSDNVVLERTSFDLAALIRNNHRVFKLKAEEKGLEFSIQLDEELEGKYVESDPTRLTQVLSNLVNNAIKFTEKGQVQLEVLIEQLTAGQMTLRFTVTDTGIGIAADRQDSVFEPYVQASSSTSRHYGGTGLGLPIVKKVLALFGTAVTLESHIDIGTKVSFPIILDYHHREQLAGIAEEMDFCLKHLKVLVVEDNPINVLVLKKALERWKVFPVVAENGRIALETLAAQDFDLILMDLYMPEMDGYAASAAIRSLGNRKAATPIIALSAGLNPDVVKKIAAVGINDYLSKPFHPDHLCEKMKLLTLGTVLN